MADTVTIPATGSGTATPIVSTDEVAVNGGTVSHVQHVKLVDGTSNGTAGLPGDAANGLDVDVTRVTGTVSVNPVGETAGVGIGAAADTSASNSVIGRLKALIALLPTALGAGGGLKVDGSGTALPVSGTVSVSGAVDTELTTADLDTGAGTDTRAVIGLARAESGGALLVGSANPLPVNQTAALPAGANAIGKLVANDGIDIGDVTVNNAAGASAVNVQDGGNSLTVDGTVTATLGANVTEDAASAGGETAVLVAGVRNDAAAAKTSADGDFGNIALDSAGRVGVSDLGGAISVDDNAGSLTIDAPVGAPAFVRLSDGAAAITALPVTDNAGSLTVDQATGSNLHTVLDSGTISTITNVVHVDDNAGSLTVDSPQLPAALGQGTMAQSQKVVLASDQSAIPVTDNAGSLTVDNAGTFAVQPSNASADAATTKPAVGLMGGWDDAILRAATVKLVDGQGRVMVFDPKTRSELGEIKLILQDIRNLLMTGDTTIAIPSSPNPTF